MEKLGMSIKDIMKSRQKHFTLKCAISMGIRLVNLLEALHDEGYIHCDIKLDNIMIGDQKKSRRLVNKIFLIDFGIS